MPNETENMLVRCVQLRAPECSWYKKLGQFKKLPEQDNSLGEKSSLELLVQVPVATHPTPVRALQLQAAHLTVDLISAVMALRGGVLQ
jgi:hypothetical protein